MIPAHPTRRTRASAVLAALAVPLLLAACGGDDDPAGPDGRDPDSYLGTYTLAPAPSTTCDMGIAGDWTATVSAVEIQDASADSLWFELALTVVGSSTFEASHQAAMALDAEHQSFAGGGPFTFTSSGVTGTGTLDVDGEFTGDDAFTADIAMTLDVSADLGAGTFNGTCTDVDATVTATRQ